MRKRKREAEEEGLFPEEAAPGGRLMPVDVQQKEFRMSMRGYRESDVDEFLDEITEELGRLHEETSQLREENRRLRERAGVAPTDSFSGGADLAEARRTGDQILAAAREEASRIVRDAEERARSAGAGAAAGAAAGGGTGLSPFLSREREFLQGLATLIQGHAEYVKTAARAVRDQATRSAGAASAAASAEAPGQAAAPPPAEPASAEPSAAEPGPAEPSAAEPRSAERAAPTGESEPAEESELTARGRMEESAPEPEAAAGSGGPEGLFPVPEPTGSGEVDLSPWQGGRTPPRRDTRPEDTAAWENPFSSSEEASAMDEPGAISSSIQEKGSPPPRREDERSLRELFWGED